MAIKRKDTPLAETPKPDYRNIKKEKKTLTGTKVYVPTAKDSTDYKKGFNDALIGKNIFFPSDSRVRGFKEAKERGLTKKN
jgi:hypothetical protein